MTFSTDHIVVSHPQPGNRHAYKFFTIIADNSIPEKPKEKTIIRDVEIIFLGPVGRQYKYMVLCKSVMFLPEETTEAEPLQKAGVYAFDEIELSVSYLGHISAIHNLPRIRARWATDRAQLASMYEGASATLFFQQIDRILSNEKELIEFISGYGMLGLHFNRWAYLHVQNHHWQQIDFYGKQPVRETATISKMRGDNAAEVVVKGYFIDEMPEEKDAMPLTFPNGDGIIRRGEPAEAEKDSRGKTQQQENYSGWVLYKNNGLTEAVITMEKDSHIIKYSLLWAG